MQTKTSRVFRCFKCLVIFYLVLNCILGLTTAVFAGYLFIFRHEGLILKAKTIVLCFLIMPAVFSIFSAVLGWSSVKRKSIKLLKFFAVVLAATDILQISGCLWCFTSLPQISEQVSVYVEEKFTAAASGTFSDAWWNDIQTKFKCCGLHGPTDYYSTKSVPVSCCGSDIEDQTKGSCGFLWQKGCSSSLTKELSKDIVLLGLIGLCTAFLQIPSVFIMWCFAKRLSKETL